MFRFVDLAAILNLIALTNIEIDNTFIPIVNATKLTIAHALRMLNKGCVQKNSIADNMTIAAMLIIHDVRIRPAPIPTLWRTGYCEGSSVRADGRC